MRKDDDVTIENEDEETETLDWESLFGASADDEGESDDEEEQVAPKVTAEEPKPAQRNEVEDDAAMYVRLRAKYPHMFQSKEGEELTAEDKTMGEKLMSMTESEFRAMVVEQARNAYREEAEVKRQLRAAVLKGLSLSKETVEKFERELDVMDASQAYAMLANDESIEWTRDSLLGREVRARGLKVPRREPAHAAPATQTDLDESDPVIATGLKMFGLTPEEVETGKVKLPKPKN